MQAIERFNITVSTATVAIMFAIIEYVLPMFQASAVSSGLSISFVTSAQLVAASKLGLTALATLGTYKVIASVLIKSIDKIPYVKPFLFGPSYVEGTWVGKFGDHPKWSVEHFEQTLDSIVIRGYAFDPNGKKYASWKTTAASVNHAAGFLTYTYDCDLMSHNTPQQGIGVFQFERLGAAKAPHRIYGYSTDLVDGIRTENDEVKISDSMIPIAEALTQARRRFP